MNKTEAPILMEFMVQWRKQTINNQTSENIVCPMTISAMEKLKAAKEERVCWWGG